MEKFGYRLSMLLRLLAIFNILQLFFNIWAGSIYPVNELPTESSNTAFITFLIYYFIDLLINSIVFFYMAKALIKKRRYYNYLGIWIFISLLTRFLFAGVATGRIVDATNFLTPSLIGLTTILFGNLIRFLRKQTVGAEVYTSLTIFMVVLFTVGFLLLIPHSLIIGGLGFSSLILSGILAGLGVLKGILPFFASMLYYYWSVTLDSFEKKSTNLEAYPELSYPADG